VAQTLVGNEPAIRWKSKRGQVHRHLLRFWRGICCTCCGTDVDSLDLLLDRGKFTAFLSARERSLCMTRLAPCMLPLGFALTDALPGQPKTTRADGFRDLPLPNEFLRNNTCRTHTQPILEVRLSLPRMFLADGPSPPMNSDAVICHLLLLSIAD
jgi:hypothetical protein